MDKEELAALYAARLNRCLAAMKILIILAAAAVVGLLVFFAVASGINMKDSNPNGVLLGIIIPAGTAAAAVTGALTSVVVAKITMVKLKKLGAE